jgi:putative cardiolipin synthase
MHNKSLTVDNQASIVGGRNIADEYFEAGENQSFADIDVLAVGDAVRAISTEFDLYWNSASAYPARLIVKREPALRRAELAQRAQAVRNSAEASGYRRRNHAHAPGAGTARRADEVRMDDRARRSRRPGQDAQPDRGERVAAAADAAHRLRLADEGVRPGIAVLRAGEAGTAALVALARSGVRVRILTNSLAGTDEVSVHAGYFKRRADLLRAGVELYEIKPPQRRSCSGAKRSASIRRRGCTPRPSRSTGARSSSARSTSIRARPSSTPRWAW